MKKTPDHFYSSNWYRTVSLAVFLTAASVSLAGPVWGEFIPPDPLDKLWEQHMLDGKASSVGIFVEGSNISISERSGARLLTDTQRGGWIETLHSEPYGINIAMRGEGFWRNGGWNVMGGVLSKVTDGPSVVQLYAKIVRHQHPYFPFNKDPSTDTGYEFFLLHRKKEISGAMIVRAWRFPPEDVASEESGHGGRIDHIRAFFAYDPSIQTATVKITGLTRPFEEQVDLSSVIQSGQQELPASGEGTK